MASHSVIRIFQTGRRCGQSTPQRKLAQRRDAMSALTNVALYALLPLVWFAMTALIYGREVRQADELLASNAASPALRSVNRGLPAVVHRGTEHFVKGYRTRFLPVVNCVRLTLTAGLPLLLLLCLGYRALNWLSCGSGSASRT